MNKSVKYVNILFLIIVAVHITASIFLSMLLFHSEQFGFTTDIIISELVIVVPAVVILLVANMKMSEWFAFRKLRISTVLLIILLTYLVMPFMTFLNIFSQVFVESAAIDIFTEAQTIHPVLAIILIGIYGPVCEEFVFRGMIYNGYARTGRRLLAIILSALLFGLLHMNLNQFLYASFMGVVCALVFEATGSLFAPIICHIVVNTHNTILMVVMMKLYEKMGIGMSEVSSQAAGLDSDMKLMTAGFFLILGLVFMALAFLVFVLICKINNSTEYIISIFRADKDSITGENAEICPLKVFFSPVLIIGIVICVLAMTGMLAYVKEFLG